MTKRQKAAAAATIRWTCATVIVGSLGEDHTQCHGPAETRLLDNGIARSCARPIQSLYWFPSRAARGAPTVGAHRGATPLGGVRARDGEYELECALRRRDKSRTARPAVLGASPQGARAIAHRSRGTSMALVARRRQMA